MKVAHDPQELERRSRAVAIGTFDGVHLGHRAVIRAAVEAGPLPTVVTFEPHPRRVLATRGGRAQARSAPAPGDVQLLSTLDRRLELLAECGVAETLVVHFTPEVAKLAPGDFARDYLLAIGAEVVVAGSSFRFGRSRSGDLELLRSLGLDARAVPLVEGISSTRIRALVQAGEVAAAAPLLGRPPEVEGSVVTGDRRGRTLGFPTANLDVPASLLVPAFGIYAGAVGERRAAISIGTNPHFGGEERRVEAYLLDWSGDLYGGRLVVELWQRLRGERAFAGESELVEQIARDVEQTRAARRPA